MKPSSHIDLFTTTLPFPVLVSLDLFLNSLVNLRFTVVAGHNRVTDCCTCPDAAARARDWTTQAGSLPRSQTVHGWTVPTVSTVLPHQA
jgi:hypothetical protein